MGKGSGDDGRPAMRLPGQEAPPTASAPMPCEDRDLYMFGQCAALAAAHRQRYPQLRFGLHWERLPDHEAQKIAWEDTSEDWDGTPMYRVQHVFTHDDRFAYDADGAHTLPFDRWDRTELDVSLQELEMTGMLEPGYMPDLQFIAKHMPVPPT